MRFQSIQSPSYQRNEVRVGHARCPPAVGKATGSSASLALARAVHPPPSTQTPPGLAQRSPPLAGGRAPWAGLARDDCGRDWGAAGRACGWWIEGLCWRRSHPNRNGWPSTAAALASRPLSLRSATHCPPGFSPYRSSLCIVCGLGDPRGRPTDRVINRPADRPPCPSHPSIR